MLPLQWKHSSEADCGRLPKTIVQLSYHVLEFARKSGLIRSGESYSIDFPEGSNCPDLSGLDGKETEKIGAESGFAPLLTGLRLLVNGGRPSSDVWSTGSFDETVGINGVSGVIEKIETAHRWNAKRFFIPESNWSQEFQDSVRSKYGIQIEFLPERGAKETLAGMGPLFAACRVEPVLDSYESPEEAIRHGSEHHGLLSKDDPKAAQEYYKTRILERLPDLCKQKLRRSGFEGGPTHLITVATANCETIRTTAATLGVSKCLVLYTCLLYTSPSPRD